jgi:hypothetical protein
MSRAKPQAPVVAPPRDLASLGADPKTTRAHQHDGVWSATVSASWSSGLIWAHDPNENTREAALASLPRCVEQCLRGYIEIAEDNARSERAAAKTALERARAYDARAATLRAILDGAAPTTGGTP